MLNNTYREMITDENVRECFNNISLKYPAIQPEVYVHQMPDNCFIHGVYSGDDIRYIFEKRTMNTINHDAMKLLEACDGTKTTVEIIDDIVSNIESKDALAMPQIVTNIVKFLAMSYEPFKHINFNQDKAANPALLNKTGSLEKMLPQHFAMELTTKCNLRCKHCYRSSSPDIVEQEIPTEKVLQILSEMHSIGARFVEITGGEPFLHSGIKEILSYVGDNYNFIGLLTNGTLVTNEMMDYLDKYKEKIIWNISLDSCLESYHDDFRGSKGAFKRTVRTIRELSQRGHTIRVAMSLSEGNLDHLKETVHFVKDDLKATFFGYSYVLDYGRGREMNWHPDSEQSRKMLEIDKYTDNPEFSNFINKVSAERTQEMKTRLNNCGAGWRTVTIGPNGKIRPCVMMDENLVVLGDIKELSIREIMDNETVDYLYNLPWPLDKECTGCGNELYCRWCAYRAIIVNTERLKQDADLCPWAKKNNINKFADLKAYMENSFSVCGDNHCSILE